MAAGRPYQFGNVNIVYVSAQDPEIKTSRLYYNNEKNPLSSNPYNTGYDTLDSQEAPANIIIEKSQSLPTKNQVILDQIAITPGGVYSEIDYLQSIRNCKILGCLPSNALVCLNLV